MSNLINKKEEKFMDRLFIIIPAYNEAANIENVVRDWYPIVNAYNGDIECKLIIVDDGSSDDTKEIVRRLAIDYPLLELLSKVNGGHGSAVLFGYRYALENNADWIFQTDSDGQTNPDEFPKFWELHESYDAILGNRQSDR